jgi:hypothetical protein
MSETDSELDVLRLQLEQLREEHRDLDAAIQRLAGSPVDDVLLIRRLKKRKLALKDRMTALERIVEPGDSA